MGETDPTNLLPENQYQALQCFDALDLPMLLLDSKNTPIFLTARGASVLGIENRAFLEQYKETLNPFITLLESVKRPYVPITHAQKIMREIELTTADGRLKTILATRNPLKEGSAGSVILFFETALFEPFLETLQLSFRNRSFHLLVSSLLGKKLELTDSSLSEQLIKASKEVIEHGKEDRAELLSLLTSALEIVDPLVSGKINIVLDLKTSALIKVNKTVFLRLISHLLIEAADFLGLNGKIKIKGTFPVTQTSTRGNTLELMITAQKGTEISEELDLLQLILSRHLLSPRYHVSITDEEAPLRLSPEIFSNDLRIASELATQADVILEVFRPDQRILAFKLEVPLLDNIEQVL